MKSRRVIPGRGVNQRAQGARITSTSTPSSGVASSEYLTLGMARFHTHICGNPKKDKKQIHCPLQKLERSQTFLSPQVLCDLSMTNQMTLSDSEGLKQKKGSMKHFYGPCKVPSVVVTRVQRTRVPQQKETQRRCQLQMYNQPLVTSLCLGSALLGSYHSLPLAFLQSHSLSI